MRALIIINGDSCDKNLLRKEAERSDAVICADGGAAHAYNANITPDYLIGDFDSIDKDTFEFYKNKNVKIEKYKREKDYTDTELCINKAIDIGCSYIVIACASGDRIDHTIANIFLLEYIFNKGAEGMLITKGAFIYCLKDTININGNPNDIISVIPYNGDIEGLNSTGLKYSMKNLNLKFGKTIGISNEMIEHTANISIKKGRALVIKETIF